MSWAAWLGCIIIILSVGCWGSYCAAVFACCCCVSLEAIAQQVKHGHNKVDDAVRKTSIRHGQSMRKHGTTAKLPRTFKVKLLQILKAEETTRHILGCACEIDVQWRLQICRVTGRCDQSYDRKSCGDGAVELLCCC